MGIKKTKFRIEAENKTDKAFRKIDKNFGKMKGAISGMLGPILALAGAAGMLMFAKNTLKAADAIGKFADRAGITTDELQKLRFAFTLAGVSNEKFDKSLVTFGKRLGKAKDGFGALAEGLKKGNQELLDTILRTNDVSGAMDAVFTAMGKATDQAKKLSIADAAFGKTGLNMTAAFKDGRDAFDAATKEAVKLGLVMREDLIRSAEATNDAFTKASGVITIQFQQAFLSLAPTLTATADFISVNMPAALQVMRQAMAVTTQAIIFLDIKLSKVVNTERIARLEGIQSIIRRMLQNGSSLEDLAPSIKEAKRLEAQIKASTKAIESDEKLLSLMTTTQTEYVTGLSKWRFQLQDNAGVLNNYNELLVEMDDKMKDTVQTFKDTAQNFPIDERAKAQLEAFTAKLVREEEALQSVLDPFKEIRQEIDALNAIKHLIPPEAMMAWIGQMKLAEEAAKAAIKALDPINTEQQFPTIDPEDNAALARQLALLKEIKTPLHEFAQEFEDLLDIKGALTDAEFNLALNDLNERAMVFATTLSASLELIEDVGETMKTSVSSALSDLLDNERDFAEVSKAIFRDLRDTIIETFTDDLFDFLIKGGKNSLLSFLNLGGGSSIGDFGGGGFLDPTGTGQTFAHGGSGIVSGIGPTDSKRVSLRVTPGEKITVQTPQQQRHGGGGVVINQNFALGLGAQVRVEMMRMMPSMSRQIRSDLISKQQRGVAG